MRRFLTVIVVLVLLVVVVDRAAWWFAQGTIADQVQSEADLSSRPEVKVGAFPSSPRCCGAGTSRSTPR